MHLLLQFSTFSPPPSQVMNLLKMPYHYIDITILISGNREIRFRAPGYFLVTTVRLVLYEDMIFVQLYTTWLFLASVYHLPSLQALGLNFKVCTWYIKWKFLNSACQAPIGMFLTLFMVTFTALLSIHIVLRIGGAFHFLDIL